MMKLDKILPYIINTLISFYIEYYHRIYNNEIIINHTDLLYKDMYIRISNGYTQMFNTDDVYSINVLRDINPYYRTYNKLSYDDNILETLVTYLEDYIISYRVPINPRDVIISMDGYDVPFESSLNITIEWVKRIIDIYR